MEENDAVLDKCIVAISSMRLQLEWPEVHTYSPFQMIDSFPY